MPKIFSRRYTEGLLESTRNDFESLQRVDKVKIIHSDAAKIAALLRAEEGKIVHTIEDGMRLVNDAFKAAGSKPEAFVEAQRVHARQRFNSCETKSIFAFVAYYLNDEVAYQTFRTAFIKDRRNDTFVSLNLSLHLKLRKRTCDAKERLRQAVEQRQMP